MAPNLADSQHVQIRDMTLSNYPPAEIANVVGCSERSVFAIQSNPRLSYFRTFRTTMQEIVISLVAAVANLQDLHAGRYLGSKRVTTLVSAKKPRTSHNIYDVILIM
jgi:hypothetical protein